MSVDVVVVEAAAETLATDLLRSPGCRETDVDGCCSATSMLGGMTTGAGGCTVAPTVPRLPLDEDAVAVVSTGS